MNIVHGYVVRDPRPPEWLRHELARSINVMVDGYEAEAAAKKRRRRRDLWINVALSAVCGGAIGFFGWML